MRIEKIILNNYRQFQHAEFTFRRRGDTDLHYIIGANGTGKTNLLNAINWCLYGDEPHVAKDSQHLPLVNLNAVRRADIGQDREVTVEVKAEAEAGNPITFKRRAVFSKGDGGQMIRRETHFEVRYNDERGNTKIVRDEEDVRTWVERFVPEGIREFFFFDGERLDTYFREATGQNIRHAVFEISQIELLESRLERKLQDCLSDLTKEAGKVNPRIEGKRTELEQTESRLRELKERIEECSNQAAISRAKVAEYTEKLKGIPDVESLDKERQQLIAKDAETKELLRAKHEEKRTLLLESGRSLLLLPAIRQSIQVIHGKKEAQEIPPSVDRSFLEEVLRHKSCGVCGRPLDAYSRSQVEELLRKVELSSETALRLVRMETPLLQFVERVNEFDKRVRDLTREVQGYTNTLAEIAQRRAEIDTLVAGYDEALVRQWYSERAKFEAVHEQSLERLGALRAQAQVTEGEAQTLRDQLEVELKKESRVRGLQRQRAFCERALQVVSRARETLMKETRDRIELATRRQFFSLIWKKQTFQDVRIGEDYSISLTHSLGYECLGSVSAGERELLALSFTLALHQTSGFDSPILIDTPVARISDVNRENFAKALAEVSTSKQIILLFTPSEYSDEIRRFLDGRSAGRYRLKPSSDETEASVEVL